MLSRIGIFIFVLAALFIPDVVAQELTLKWGKVSDDEMAMTSFPADTQASAVILADIGKAVVDGRTGRVRFDRHRRIKILTEAGYEWGTHTVTHNDNFDLGKVRGHTFVQDDRGKVTRHKLDGDAIFKEDVSESVERVRFTLPALQPGAVIEYKYTMHSDSPGLVPDWTFQSAEPTIYSEFSFEYPEDLRYVIAGRGNLDFDVEDAREVRRETGAGYQQKWVMKHVPPLREEPFMTRPDDYRSSIELQLSAYYQPGHGMIQVLHTWEDVAQRLREMDSFGLQINPVVDVRRAAESVTVGLTSDMDRMTAIYDYVRSTIRWNGFDGFLAGQDLHKVLESREGDAGEINLLLVAMLRSVGMRADPVLISTRSNGSVLEVYPLVNQFNYVIAQAVANGAPYLLDATDELRPYDLLPTRALNGRGWLVSDSGDKWIDIAARGRHKRSVLMLAALGEDGGIKGTVQSSDQEYAAFDLRERLNDLDPEDVVREAHLDNLTELAVDSVTIDHKADLGEPLRMTGEFEVPLYAQVVGDYIYFNPLIGAGVTENPFKMADRTFPIDLAFARDRSYTLRLKLPEGYALQEAPADAEFRPQSGGGFFRRSIAEGDGEVVVQMRFSLGRSVYPARYYEDIREFYDRVVSTCSQQVVLRRSQPVAAEDVADGE